MGNNLLMEIVLVSEEEKRSVFLCRVFRKRNPKSMI